MMEIERPGNPNPPMYEHSDSTSSIDRELDWLIGSEAEGQSDAVQIETNDYERDPFDRSESRREEPSEAYPLNEGDRVEQHEMAVYRGYEEHETVEDNPQTEEQRQLELELQKLKEEGFLPMEDPPEYDIADRVRELNEQLQAEGETPERTDRKVTFSENVIAVEFPEELYGDDDDNDTGTNEMEQLSEHKDGGDNSGERTQSVEVTGPNDLEVAKLTLEEERDQIKSKETKQYDQNGDPQSPRGQDEKVLIERDGKFELVSVKDMSPVERRSMGLEISPVEDETDAPQPITPNGHGDAPIQEPPPQDQGTTLQPTPPSKPRPSTATDSTGLRRSQLPARRIQSAHTQRDSTGSGQNTWSVSYTGYSKYGLTPEQKEHKREQMRLRMQQQQQQRKAEEEEQRRKQEEAESAFQAWLEHKKDTERERRQAEKEEKEQKKSDGDKKDQSSNEDNFKFWLQEKHSQARREHRLKKQAEEEKVNGYLFRDRKECDQAFRQWVRSKNEQLRKERLLKRSNATVSRQLARQSRKSKNLAKALETAQVYRYTDWYGYRF